MKKDNTFWGIFWIIIAVILTGVLIRGLNAEGLGGFVRNSIEKPIFSLNKKKFLEDDMTFEDITQENTFDSQVLNSIEITSHSASLEFMQSDDDMIHVNLIGKWNRDKLPEIECKDGRLYVKTKNRVRFIFHPFFYVGKRQITVLVPKDCFSDETQINLSCASGSIKVQDLLADTIKMEAASGSLHITDCTAKALEISAASGSVNINGGKYELLKSETASGSTNIESSFDQIKLESASGSVKIRAVTPIIKDSSIEAVSGSVKIKLPPESEYKIDYETMSGSFKDELSGTTGRRNGTYTRGSGSPKIKISTVSGSIRISD